MEKHQQDFSNLASLIKEGLEPVSIMSRYKSIFIKIGIVVFLVVLVGAVIHGWEIWASI